MEPQTTQITRSKNFKWIRTFIVRMKIILIHCLSIFQIFFQVVLRQTPIIYYLLFYQTVYKNKMQMMATITLQKIRICLAINKLNLKHSLGQEDLTSWLYKANNTESCSILAKSFNFQNSPKM